MASKSIEITQLSDVYAYGVEPINRELIVISAEINKKPSIVAYDPERRFVTDKLTLGNRYRGVSSTSTSDSICRVVTYRTTDGKPDLRLEGIRILVDGKLSPENSIEFDFAERILRVYDICFLNAKSGNQLFILSALIETGGRKTEGAFLFECLGSEIVLIKQLKIMSGHNELRSITAMWRNDSDVFVLACRRYWLKNEAFLFQILPEERLIDTRAFESANADFQQVGSYLQGGQDIAYACIHRHRRDVDGIKYHLDWFDGK